MSTTETHVRPDRCQCCQWPTTDLIYMDPLPTMSREGKHEAGLHAGWLCEVCRSSFAGTAFCYPKTYPTDGTVAMVAWGINRILAEIRKEAI